MFRAVRIFGFKLEVFIIQGVSCGAQHSEDVELRENYYKNLFTGMF